ncbi:MAG: hypothetical protein MPK06_01300 [Alphaproteobacteria bacterium]|nr:hypothetical protein [Alphaproteobacteria bacterium]MDA7983118.1 hypothetical protein [Alphaproteobacteria bacterium]MDA7984100.1 hypothetical protein [Alphaproteobacteria bacterium]MDA7987068.1 hypothetical protein [Alphaproteobacteria bacterium]MDA7988144.1 hypothetical protein [Alphaproteobacteria bacterium]
MSDIITPGMSGAYGDIWHNTPSKNKPAAEQQNKPAAAPAADAPPITEAEAKDLSIEHLTESTLDQAKSLGSLLEQYAAEANKLTTKLDAMRQFLAFVQEKTPADSDGTLDKSVLRNKAAEFKTKYGFDPIRDSGMSDMVSGGGTITQSQVNQISEAVRSRSETIGSQNETVQTRMKRVYESRNECYDFASSLIESIGRSLSSIIRAISGT